MPSIAKAEPGPTTTDPGESHRLPGVLDSARTARRAVDRFLCDLGRPDLVESAALVVGELVANAVVHGRPPVHLDLAWSTYATPALRLDVHDHGSILLHAVDRHADDEAERGRGLVIVDHLAARWGLGPHPVHGTHAWAEITAAE
ncbi:ATP-binding protein [Nocardiopsis sp. CNR-923]|uniref:ATP-binding protein n=1 Tax=Nocardiopsis sp. CNR-923 TaxID=1904965 RepID=UPI00096AA8DE|nr:ATP-binding protein [Nocardiopsis sp. CNR-923]